MGKFFYLVTGFALLSSPALAQRSWNQTGSGTLNWSTSGNWSPAGAPGATDDARVTNDLAAAQTITNLTGTINFLAISNGLGSATTKVISSAGFVSQFGVQLGKNSVLEIAADSRLGTNQNLTFNLRTGGQPGSLIISNGAILYLVNGAGATTNTIVNSGTIQLISNAGQNSQINYGQSLAFTNDTLGTIVKSGTGTGSFIGNFANNNRAFQNNGTILVQGGTLRIDPRDAFSRGGFQNSSTGFVQIDTNAVMEIRRTINAWSNGPSPTNFGTVFMNGGELRTIDTDTPVTNTSRIFVNASTGIIRGNGLVDLTVTNGGVIEARSGTLSFVASAGNVGTWASTNFGGAASVLNFTTGNFDLGGGTLLNSNGAIRLISGANVTLSTSYRQNWGTIDFAGVANLFIANSASANSLTNEWVIKKSANGTATLTTGFGSGQNNYGLINNGTIDISAGGRLIINTSNSFSNPFNNLNGTVFIGGSSTVRLARTSAAWAGGTLPGNSGTITLSGGVLETADDTGLTSGRFLRNAGTINGSGTINASITNVSGGVISPGLSLGTLNIGGSVVFGSNSTLNIELGTPGLNDLVTIAGIATINPGSILNISGGSYGSIYTVMTFAASSGAFDTVSPNYIVAYNSTNLTLEVVPEPSTVFLTTFGFGLVMWLRTRRKSW